MKLMSLWYACAFLIASQACYGALTFSDYDNNSEMQRVIPSSKYSGMIEISSLFDGIAPKGWVVNIDPSLNNTKVKFERDFGWKDELRTIEALNPQLHIQLNKINKVIAIASSESRLKNLISRNPLIWKAEKGETLSTVFEKWSKKSNVEIIYTSKFDYKLLTNSHFMGKLSGENGVVNRILKSTIEKEPLSADYQPNIPAIVIVDGGAKKIKG